MINTKRVLLIIFAILIPFVTIYFSINLLSKKQEDVKGVSGVMNECIPSITNMMPNIAYVNREYLFVPKVVGCDIEDVEIEVRGVDWLEVKGEKYIQGIPTKFDLGVHRVILTVKNDIHSNKYVEYIIVEENEK